MSSLIPVVITHNDVDVVEYVATEHGYNLTHKIDSALEVIVYAHTRPGVTDYILDRFNTGMNTLTDGIVRTAPIDLEYAVKCNSTAMTQRLLQNSKYIKIPSSVLSHAYDPAVL
jgi:hypothetical protein